MARKKHRTLVWLLVALIAVMLFALVAEKTQWFDHGQFRIVWRFIWLGLLPLAVLLSLFMSIRRSISRNGDVKVDDSGNAIVTYERFIDHPLDKVWEAITDPEGPYGLFESADLRTGGRVKCNIGSKTGDCTISAIEPKKLIEYRSDSLSEGAAGQLCRWQLKRKRNGCNLTFTTTIGPNDPEQLRILVGWHHWIDVLRGVLDGDGEREMILDEMRTNDRETSASYIKILQGLYPGWRYSR